MYWEMYLYQEVNESNFPSYFFFGGGVGGRGAVKYFIKAKEYFFSMFT